MSEGNLSKALINQGEVEKKIDNAQIQEQRRTRQGHDSGLSKLLFSFAVSLGKQRALEKQEVLLKRIL